MLLKEQRELVVEYGKKLVEAGLTVGTFGNLSIYEREQKLVAISPSGMDYFCTTPEDVVVLTVQGEHVDGARKPSSEVDLHCLLYQNRPDVNAVVHTHSTYAPAFTGQSNPSTIWSPIQGGTSPVFPTIPLALWNWHKPPKAPWDRSITRACWATMACWQRGEACPLLLTWPSR